MHTLVKSEKDAKRMTQDIFANVWIKREKIDSAKNFNAYLLTIVKNSILEYLTQNESDILSKREFAFDDNYALDRQDIVKYTETVVDVAVSCMPENQRLVCRLRHKEGLDYDQIAERMNITGEAVKNYLCMANNELKELITLFLLLFLPERLIKEDAQPAKKTARRFAASF